MDKNINVIVSIVEQRIVKLLGRVMSKVNRYISEDFPESGYEIDLDISSYVKSTMKNLENEIVENIEVAEKNEVTEIAEKNEVAENKNVTVIGTVYNKKGQEGDFDWHIKSDKYDDALFLFNDDEKRRKWKRAGAGNAVIRKYNKYAQPDKPRSHGIVTGNEDGYTELTDKAKKAIDESISEAREIIKKYNYKKVYYSAKTPNGMIGTSIFKVGDDVISYITDQIRKLEK